MRDRAKEALVGGRKGLARVCRQRSTGAREYNMSETGLVEDNGE